MRAKLELKIIEFERRDLQVAFGVAYMKHLLLNWIYIGLGHNIIYFAR